MKIRWFANSVSAYLMATFAISNVGAQPAPVLQAKPDTATAPAPKLSGGAMTAYCASIAKLIGQKWQPKDGEDTTGSVVVSIDEQGKITSVEKEMTSKSSAVGLIKHVTDLKKVPTPPGGAAVKLSVYYCQVHHGCEVSLDKLDYGPYMADLQRRIKRAWFPPRGLESKHTVIAFSLNQDGSISQPKLVESSDSEAANTASLDAVRNAAPYRPLPDGAPSHLDISFTLDYNKFKGAGR